MRMSNIDPITILNFLSQLYNIPKKINKTKQQRVSKRIFVLQFNFLKWYKEYCSSAPQQRIRETFTHETWSLVIQNLCFTNFNWIGTCLLWKPFSHLQSGEDHDETSWVYTRGEIHGVFSKRGFQTLCFLAGQMLPITRLLFFYIFLNGNARQWPWLQVRCFPPISDTGLI